MDEKVAEKVSFESIKINENLTLMLVPRIKLNFICGCICGFCDIMMQEAILKGFVVHGFRNRRYFRNPLIIPKEDVRVCYYSLPRMADDMTVIAEGFLFYRDPILMNRESCDKLRGFMLQQLPTYKTHTSGNGYMVKYSLPPSEDPDLTSFSSEKVPTLVIKGFPTHWFTDQSDSSQPSMQLLRLFFEQFGNVRDIRVEEVVSVEYEDRSYLYKALESLRGCSLQKHGSGESVDYDLILNEEKGLCKKKRGLEYDLLLPPSKRLITNQAKINADDAFKQLVRTEIYEDVKTKVDEKGKTKVDEDLKQFKDKVDVTLQKHGSDETEEQGLCKKKRKQAEICVDEEDVMKQVKNKVDEDLKQFKKEELDEQIKQIKTMVDENLKDFLLSNLQTLL